MIIDLGVIDYSKYIETQKKLVTDRACGLMPDSLVVCEHAPVFTIGRSGSLANMLIDEGELKSHGLQLIWTDRGGDITYHGPGQLMIYPIINLASRERDLHRYLRELEGAVLSFLASYGITGNTVYGKTGVWISGRKVSFIGISARNWIACHGVSINISCDLSYFDMIHPCGLKGISVTSLSAEKGIMVPMSEARAMAIDIFSSFFGIGKVVDAGQVGVPIMA